MPQAKASPARRNGQHRIPPTGLLVVAQTAQGEEIPLKLLEKERATILEQQAQVVGVDLSASLTLLLEASLRQWPGAENIEPGREVDRQVKREAQGTQRRVSLPEELLARLAGAEWSNPPHVGVTDYIGLTFALVSMETEDITVVKALVAQGQEGAQVAQSLTALEPDEWMALAGSEAAGKALEAGAV